MIQRIGLLLLTVTFLGGCFGRIHNSDSGRKVDCKSYGLDCTHPALLVFSAVWCKPCMAEIHSLNLANEDQDLKGKLQIASYIVEGPRKGVSAAPKDTDLVVSPGGDRPNYKMTTDPNWNHFDALRPDSGRSLPMMVFVDGNQTIVRIVQRSMVYETELRPALLALARGQKPIGPKPEEPVGHRETLPMSEWIAQPGHDAASQIYSNVNGAWTRGLGDFNFLADDMPFENSKMTVNVLDDGTSTPAQAVWKASSTNCKLTVFFLPDGSYQRSEGICR